MKKTIDYYDVDGNLKWSEDVDPAIAQEEDNNLNRAYLYETDWYVTRKAETGKAIPDDVLAKREAARAAIAEVPFN